MDFALLELIEYKLLLQSVHGMLYKYIILSILQTTYSVIC